MVEALPKTDPHVLPKDEEGDLSPLPSLDDDEFSIDLPPTIHNPNDSKTLGYGYCPKEVAISLHRDFHVCAIPEYQEKGNPWGNIRYWLTDKQRWAPPNDIGVLTQAIDRRIQGYKNKKGDQLVPDAKYYREVNNQISMLYPVPLIQWDSTRYIGFLNGVVDRESDHPEVLLEMKPEFYITKFNQFTLLSRNDVKPELWFDKLHHATEDWYEFLNYCAACIQRKDVLYFLVCLGKPSSGKSPWIGIISKCLGENSIGRDKFSQMGDKGGLYTSWDKLVNIDPDINMSYLNNNVLEILKKVYGGDGAIPIRNLFQNSFKAKVAPRMILGANQLLKFVAGCDMDGFFKRSFICQFKQKYDDDSRFLNWIYSEEIQNQFGSYCFYRRFKDRREQMGKDKFVARTKKLWQASAYPVKEAMTHICRYSHTPDAVIQANKLSTLVMFWLIQNGISPPANLQNEITESVHFLGGDKRQQEKSKAYEQIEFTREGLLLQADQLKALAAERQKEAQKEKEIQKTEQNGPNIEKIEFPDPPKDLPSLDDGVPWDGKFTD